MSQFIVSRRKNSVAGGPRGFRSNLVLALIVTILMTPAGQDGAAAKSANLTVINQKGPKNMLSIKQQGPANVAQTHQVGGTNNAEIGQDGANNRVRLAQSGTSNTAAIEQSGGQNRVLLVQSGHMNRRSVVSTPDENEALSFSNGPLDVFIQGPSGENGAVTLRRRR